MWSFSHVAVPDMKHLESAPETPSLDDSKVAATGDDGLDENIGVRKVEAAHKVYGRYSKWFLFLRCVSSF